MAAEIGGDGWESNPPRTPHSAPQTVLKTAGGPSGAVHKRPLEFIPRTWHSVLVRLRAHTYAKLAVILAVSEHPGPETSIPSVRSESLATPHHAVVGAVARRGLDVSAWRPYAPEIQVGKVGGKQWRGSSRGPISKTATATSCVPARSRACRRRATGALSCSYSIFREDRSTAWTSRVVRSRLLATRRRSWVTSTGASVGSSTRKRRKSNLTSSPRFSAERWAGCGQTSCRPSGPSLASSSSRSSLARAATNIT